MSRRATIADVARLAGVHPGTVSRALNSGTEGQVNPETIRRVRAAARQLGYTPNSIARGLRTSSSTTIGVIIPDLTNPIFPPMVRGIESYLAPRGFSALVVNTDGSDTTEQLVFQSLIQRQVDGLIFATGHQGHATATESFDLGLKAVMVNRESGGVPYPAVVGDDAQGIRAALEHLAGLGHRRIVHLAGPLALSTSQVRRDAFVAGCASLGLDGTVIETAAYSVDEGLRAMDQVIGFGGALSTAVIAGNDLLALGVYRSLRTNGLRCPDDVSVVGFNDMLFAGDFEPAMTTVRVPHFELGVEAARLLCEEIETSVITAIKVVLPVELVVRASTARTR
ncbi:MAG: LacI family DNA-binding transcriptional regulator [Actinomycetales bacterium]|jgi:LacI family transcriptional regulator|nr:LacI family DNA-binding transcriptional regulator [Leifsonia sp.]